MYCSSRDLQVVVKRTSNEELLERLSLALLINDHTIYPITWWILIEVLLAVAYIIWFTIGHEHRPVPHAIASAVFAALFFCFIMIPVIKLMGPRLTYGGMAACHGEIMFRAKLLWVDYSVIILLLAGFFAELAALAIMARQIVKAIMQRKESAQSAVG